ncbi:hypothetical protein [Roseofilum casamattae]|uniref:Glycosyltransferase n=1 Tax=Roseofilum casamattae BLCC-M143 TaxID=3022442 RepID=A0ABT7BSK4_9CYAN|nr:hypothetical protein [Roseofilum casamattae]MDJ1182177.1 hypothetical protein [Roseofilum casamattae BLCC-M143]
MDILEWKLNTPVCLIIFNRPELTEKLFAVIRQVKPPKLLVIADGPREDKLGEQDKCQATRDIISGVYWDCEVFKNYSDTNLGLKHRIASGLDWVFELVEEAIILEDDCLPDLTFFRFCEELLNYYRETDDVMVITGTNFFFGYQPTPDSYYFSRYIDCWGWATWRRAWQHFDFTMEQWPQLRDQNWLQELLQDTRVAEQWMRIFESTYQGYINSWAFRWKFACWLRDGLTIVPETNLVSNLGFNVEATNTQFFGGLLDGIPRQSINFPLKHPDQVARNDWVDDLTQKVVFESNFLSLVPELISTFWYLDDSQLAKSRETILKVLRHALQLKPLSLQEINQPTIEEINQIMSANPATESKEIQYLLAAMLYVYPHQLPIRYDLSSIPEWLLPDYIKFSLIPPQLYQEVGDAQKYLHYLQTWLNHLHYLVIQNPNSDLSRLIIEQLQQCSNFEVLYCNDADLQPLYAKRAELIEIGLYPQGRPSDEQLSPRLPERSKIRLGIVAENFGLQPDTWTNLPIYKHLNRDRFEIIFYSIQATGDRLERYCSGHADAGVQLPDTLTERVNMLRAEDLDILLIANTTSAKIDSLALLANFRLARIQILGFNSTIYPELNAMDYYLSGKALGLTKCDKVIQLPGIGQAIDFGCEAQGIPSDRIARGALGIAEDEIVYIAGGSNKVITPEVELTWTKLLTQVPNSRLIIYTTSARSIPKTVISAWKRRFEQTLEKHNLSGDRLIWLVDIQSHADVQALLQQANVYLSNYPYTDFISLIEPLLANVPPVVLSGQNNHTRFGATLLNEIELSQFITADENAYLEQAVTLGSDRTLWQQARTEIARSLESNPAILNSASYSAQIDTLLQTLFQEQQQVEIKENLRLRDINIIIFPDWSQSEEILLFDLATVLQAAIQHPQNDEITLVVETGGISDEDADAAMSAAIMQLLMEENIDTSDSPELCLTGSLGRLQWQALASQLQGRLAMNAESSLPAVLSSLPVYSVEQFVKTQFPIST